MTAHKGLRTHLDEVTISTLPSSIYYHYIAAIRDRDLANWTANHSPDASRVYRRNALRQIWTANITKRQLQGGR
jgi:hypothetical protein